MPSCATTATEGTTSTSWRRRRGRWTLPVYATIDRLRYVPDDRDPEASAEQRSADADAALAEADAAVPRPAARARATGGTVARLGEIARERAKDILVLENLAPDGCCTSSSAGRPTRGGPEDPRLGFCVTIDELPALLEDPTAFTDGDRGAGRAGALPQRAGAAVLVRAARSRIRSTWERRGRRPPALRRRAASITGIAVSSGSGLGTSPRDRQPGRPSRPGAR